MSREIDPEKLDQQVLHEIESFNEFQAMAGIPVDASEFSALLGASVVLAEHEDIPISGAYKQMYNAFAGSAADYFFHPVTHEVLETAASGHRLWLSQRETAGEPLEQSLTVVANPFITELFFDDAGLSNDEARRALIDFHITNPRNLSFPDLFALVSSEKGSSQTAVQRWWKYLSQDGMSPEFIVNKLAVTNENEPTGTLKIGRILMELFSADTNEEVKIRDAEAELASLEVEDTERRSSLEATVAAATARRELLAELTEKLPKNDLQTL